MKCNHVAGLSARTAACAARPPYHRTLQNAGVAGGWLKRCRDCGFPSQCSAETAANVRENGNVLAVRVTNLWPNRLIYDVGQPGGPSWGFSL